VKYLHDYYGNKEFKIVEVFMYDQLKKNGDKEILQKTGREMKVDFLDTKWNTETSVSNFETTFFGCTTKVYEARNWNSVAREFNKRDDYVLVTYSYNDTPIKRIIDVEKNDGTRETIEQSVHAAGSWVWNVLSPNSKAVSVYQDGNLLYNQQIKNLESWAGFRT
jgi:hypothetical protein